MHTRTKRYIVGIPGTRVHYEGNNRVMAWMVWLSHRRSRAEAFDWRSWISDPSYWLRGETPAPGYFAVWLVVWTMWQVVSIFGGRGSIAGFTVSMIERVLLLSVALLTIRLFSPDLVDLIAGINANPDVSLAGVLGVLFVWLPFSLAGPRSFASDSDAPPAAGVAYGVGARRSTRHPLDIKRSAIRERPGIFCFLRRYHPCQTTCP